MMWRYVIAALVVAVIVGEFVAFLVWLHHEPTYYNKEDE